MLLRCSFCGNPVAPGNAVLGREDMEPRGVLCVDCLEALVILNQDRFALHLKAPEREEDEGARGLASRVKPVHPTALVRLLDEYVQGQREAKEALAVSVAAHIQRILDPSLRVNPHLFLIGPTGTGKTYMLKVLSRHLKLPLVVASATSFTQAGYVGDDVETLTARLYHEAGGNLELAQVGIIFLDEADKIARKHGRFRSSERDVGGEGVQHALLKMVEGTKVNIPKNTGGTVRETTNLFLDTSRVLWVFAGAFEGLDQIVAQRLSSLEGPRVGFTSGARRRELSKEELYSLATYDDLIEYGMIPELMGRVGHIAVLRALGEEDLYRILRSKESPLWGFLELARKFDLQVDLPEDTLREVARTAAELGTGARALNTVLSAIFRPLLARASPGERVTVSPEGVRSLFSEEGRASLEG